MDNTGKTIDISTVLDRLRTALKHGMAGRDYTFKPSEKNKQLDSQYYIDDEKKRHILCGLTEGDFVISEISDAKGIEGCRVYIFKNEASLIPRFHEEITYELVKLYIKIVWNQGNALIILSIHKDEPYNY